MKKIVTLIMFLTVTIGAFSQGFAVIALGYLAINSSSKIGTAFLDSV